MVRGLLLMATLLMTSCGPINKPTPKHAVVVFHNQTSFVAHIAVRWAIGGLYVGINYTDVLPYADAEVVMGVDSPDFVEVQTTAWTSAYGPADWGSFLVIHVVYPTGFTWYASQ